MSADNILPVTLTVAQLLVLSTAAQRPDHMVLPLPTALKVRGATQRRLLASLLKAALVVELAVTDDTLAWRHDASGERFGLRLTADGLAAVGLAAVGSDSSEQPAAIKSESLADLPRNPQPAASEPAPRLEPPAIATASASRADAGAADEARPLRPGGKLGTVLQAVSSDAGATLAELVALTGWLPHTTRAAVTGLRKRGFAIDLVEQDARKAYRLARVA